MTDFADITPPSRPPPILLPELSSPVASTGSAAETRSRFAIGREVFWSVVVIGFVVVLLQATTPSRYGHAPAMYCSSHLRHIGLALSMYANTSGGTYPPSWQELYLDQGDAIFSPNEFVCRASATVTPAEGTVQQIAAALVDPTAAHCSYTYAAANRREADLTDDDVLAFETVPDEFSGSVVVLFGDMHTEWLDAEPGLGRDEVTFARLKADFAAGVRPLRLRP